MPRELPNDEVHIPFNAILALQQRRGAELVLDRGDEEPPHPSTQDQDLLRADVWHKESLHLRCIGHHDSSGVAKCTGVGSGARVTWSRNAAGSARS